MKDKTKIKNLEQSLNDYEKLFISECTKEFFEKVSKNIQSKIDNLILYDFYKEYWKNYEIIFKEAQKNEQYVERKK